MQAGCASEQTPEKSLDSLPTTNKRRPSRLPRLFLLFVLVLLLLTSGVALFHNSNSAGPSSASTAGLPMPGAPGSATGSGQSTSSATSRLSFTLTDGQSMPQQFSSGFLPYFELGSVSMQQIAQSSGQKNFTLAFVVAKSITNCTPMWESDPTAGLDRPGLAADIQAIRAQGGDVSISFGGGGSIELAQACNNVGNNFGDKVGNLEAQYQAVVTLYHPARLDFDIENGLQDDPGTYTLRNAALAALQQANPGLAISFTLPAAIDGLDGGTLGLVRNAISQGVNISIVNLMTMDYVIPIADMGATVISGANGLHGQLQQLYPGKSSAQLWAMVGITPMIGQNDSGGEIFSLKDAQTVFNFAQANQIGELSMWELSRDNGNCPGDTADESNCSGIRQGPYDFTNIFRGLAVSQAEGGPCIEDLPLDSLGQPIRCSWKVDDPDNPGMTLITCIPASDSFTTGQGVAEVQVYQCDVPSDGGQFFCNVPVELIPLNVVTFECSKTEGGPFLSCTYKFNNIGDCNPKCKTPIPASDTVTGLPTATPESQLQPIVCAVATTSCPAATAGASPDKSDWLFGTNGLLVATTSADTYGVTLVNTLWSLAYGLAIALLAIPFALAGLQIVHRTIIASRAGIIELFARILITVVAVSLSLFVLKMFINLENELTGTLFSKIPTPQVATFMPSANWSCNAHQFFGNLFNLTVYTAQHTAKDIDIKTYEQNTYTTSSTLIVNLSSYVLTLLSVLLAIQLTVRLALINMYIIVSPLTIVCSALPGEMGSGITRAWLKGFMTLLFVQVLQLVVLYAGIQFIPATWMAGNDWVNLLFAHLIPIAMLGMTLNVPKMLNVSVVKMLSTVSSSIGGAMSGIVLLIRGA